MLPLLKVRLQVSGLQARSQAAASMFPLNAHNIIS